MTALDDIKQEAAVRSVKMLDIGYVTVLFFLCGYYGSGYLERFLENYFGTVRDYENRSNTRLLLEIIVQICLIGIAAYIGRNAIELIPYPLNGVKGYNHLKLKELTGPGLITFFFVIFSYNLQQKIMIIRNRKLKK